MLSTRFGIEIEMTGITRRQAADLTAKLVNGTVRMSSGYEVKAEDGRCWRFVYDGSINTRSAVNTYGGDEYSTELVSPILTYEHDIDVLQNIVRELRRNGAFTNGSCGIHIHLDGRGHTAKSLRNFANIIYNRGDLLYEALGIIPERARYCQKLSKEFMDAINCWSPSRLTLNQLEDIWYEIYHDYGYRTRHYHDSRYHFMNLHSFFNGHGTVELRGFNSTLHAGVIRSYIVLALAINHQALTATMTKRKKAECTSAAMENWLKQMGVDGPEFKTCIKHLCKVLEEKELTA